MTLNEISSSPTGGNGRELYCPPYSKDFTESSPKNGIHNTVHMVAERDTDSVAPTPTPTPQHPHHSQHYHLNLHEIRALQVFQHSFYNLVVFVTSIDNINCFESQWQ